MASVRGLTPEAIRALIEDATRDYKVVRESLTTMQRRYGTIDSELDSLNKRMDDLPSEIGDSIDSVKHLEDVLAEAKSQVDSLRSRFPIKTVDISDDAITAAKIEAGAIVAEKIASGAVVAEKLAAGAVVSEKIHAEAVTAEKLAADSVTAGSIAADSVLTRHIGTEQVTAEKLKAGSVEADKIAAGAVTAGAIAAGAVTADSIAAGAVTADSIEAGAIRFRPNSVLPDAVLGGVIPYTGKITLNNPAPGLKRETDYFFPNRPKYYEFPRSVKIYANSKYIFEIDLVNGGAYAGEPAVYLLFDAVPDHSAEFHYTVGDRVRTKAVRSSSIVSGTPSGMSIVRVDYGPYSSASWGEYDHITVSTPFQFMSSSGINHMTLRGVYISVAGHYMSRIDILAQPPTTQDLEETQRATQMFAEDLSAAMGQLSTNLTATARELSAIRKEFSTSTSTPFMLVWPDIQDKNDVSLMNGYVGDLIDQFVLHNDSNRPVAYTSTVSVSQTNSGRSDVVRSGIAAPKSYVGIGPYNDRTPASVLVEPMAVESVVIEDFDIEFTESDRDIVNGKPNPNSLRKRILMVPSKDIQAVSLEVIQGEWGNGQDRVDRLREAGYDPEVIQRVVNGLVPQNNKFEDRPDYYQRLTFSADVVVPQVGSWLSATTVEVYLVQWTKYKGYNSVFKRVVEQSQRAGSFGTHRFNVSYNLNYDGPFPYAGLPSDWDVTTKLEHEYDQFQLVVQANNGNGQIIGTIASGGITLY